MIECAPANDGPDLDDVLLRRRRGVCVWGVVLGRGVGCTGDLQGFGPNAPVGQIRPDQDTLWQNTCWSKSDLATGETGRWEQRDKTGAAAR